MTATATLEDVAKKKESPPESAELTAARELVRQAKEQGLSLTGPDGLLKQLTKTVLETALNEELTEHLGHDKHAIRCSEPATASEQDVQAARHPQREGRRHPHTPVLREARVWDVHPVPAGDERRDRDDRRPARHLLHHLVLAVIAQADVALHDRRHEIAEPLRRFVDSQDMVVDVLKVGVDDVGQRRVFASHQTADNLPHRDDKPVKPYECPAHLEPPALFLRRQRIVGEESLAHLVVVVVESMDCVEVAVGNDVEQTIEKEA